MQPSAEYFVPASGVRCVRSESTTVLTSANGHQRYTLSESGEELWSLLHDGRRTVDRLVMALARRSSGQALASIPDHVMEELDRFIQRGLVTRIAD
jgi:hypothetical protein